MKRRRRGPVVATAIAGATTIAIAAAWFAGYRVNETRSLPPGIWHVDAGRPVARGDVVFFCPEATPEIELAVERGYLRPGLCASGSEPMFKPVVAIEGDVVDLTNDGLLVNGELIPQSAPVPSDGSGLVLPRPPVGERTVMPGELWVISSYTALSYDSRYFGAIDRSSIHGVATPVWVDTSQ